ncbi:MAG: site-specific DNA-methyltransferase [Acidobacteriota bacterium]|nr:MAG: site-specific DNA-methyltransferase [Acidobacteriota bacterium]
MASKKTKLELTWIGKDERPRLEPRILLEDKERSYHAEHRVSDDDIFDNILIKGDNLLALKALEQEFTGKVKCIYIDPPYNTGSAFSHYEDGIEHSLWLSLMRDRIEILRKLLCEDGSLWISIDDDESHYLKVAIDEVFGRSNFVSNVIWQKKASPQANAVWLSDSHDHILVYAKNKEIWRPNLLERSESADSRYSNPDNDRRGPWSSGDFTLSLTGGQRGAQFARTGISANIYEIVTPSGRIVTPPSGRCWTYSKDKYLELAEDNRVWFGQDGNNVPRLKRFLAEVQEGMVAMTIWPRTEVGDNQESKREVQQFNPTDIFATPKPERLMQRILHLGTNEGDVVLDSFGGSGTTAAVAHKMKRRWIMVELGDHCYTHIIPRLKKVIDGEDQGGITKAVNWKGGGGFRFYELAPSLLKKDKWDNYIINPEYNAEMLAEAMCKHLGFKYEPSDSIYWVHGYSTEADFIYVTTQNLTREMLQAISDEVGDERTLLICCKAFRAGKNEFANLTLEKIPNAILKRCEWDKGDYSLQVESLTVKEPEPGTQQGLVFDEE